MNAASWSEPITSGSMIAIFGANLAAELAAASAPLPFTLAGTSVTINGIAAPLSFVSRSQLNAQVPFSLTGDGVDLVAAHVVVTTAVGSASTDTALGSGAPGFFTADGSGCGQAAALNIRPDGSVSVNSPSNSAAPGDYIALFGAGFGLPVNHLDDGAASSGPAPLSTVPGLTLDGAPVTPLYAGLAPGVAGVDQLNFQIPATARNGCAVPVRGNQITSSPNVTVSVQNGRGQCTDPPIQSWGQIMLTSTTGNTSGDNFYAVFPAGPNVTPTPPEEVVYAPEWKGNSAQIFFQRTPFFINQRSCAVPGYANLSAGSIRVTPPSGDPVTIAPLADGIGGVVYSGTLPSGFVAPGAYTVSGTLAASVSLSKTLTVGSPIRIETAFPPGTVIPASQPLTIQWTGGDPDSLVRFAITSSTGQGTSSSSYTYAHVSDGSLTITPSCTFGNPLNPKVCTFGIPPSSNASISVEVMPDPTEAGVNVPGITGPVSLTWRYSYSFLNLVLAE